LDIKIIQNDVTRRGFYGAKCSEIMFATDGSVLDSTGGTHSAYPARLPIWIKGELFLRGGEGPTHRFPTIDHCSKRVC